jgi:hypothetical protein
MIFMTNRKVRLALLLVASALTVSSCAPLQPPSATGPRGNDPLYPILLNEDNQRREAIVAALKRLAQPAGNSATTGPQLQPVTATILSLPANAGSSFYLPKVGATAVMNEEETRESLRRFIKEWQGLIGADPSKLSLVERVDRPDGSKLANYEQRPFRYPIRGNYGKLQIHFTADRRVLNLSSTCIPYADQMQTALSPLSVKLKAEEAVQQLRDNGIAYEDAKRNKVSFKVAATGEINPRGLVTYILPSKSRPDALEFHLAWEIELTNAPVTIAYVDAMNGEIVAAE